MADSAGKLTLNVVKKECPNLTCGYKAGDSQKLQDRVVTRIDQKLKHRVSDGSEVRKLEEKLQSQERVLKACLASAIARKDSEQAEMIKYVLNGKKKSK